MDARFTPLRQLLKDARSKTIPQGQIFLYADDNLTESFILRSGFVKVFDIDEKGEDKVLQIIKAPAILPLESLLPSQNTISRYWGSLTDIELSVFSPRELRTRIYTSPQLSAYVIGWLTNESRELLDRIDGINKNDAKSKIINVLRYLSDHCALPAKRGWKRVEFPLTHQLIADIAGITRESTTIHMGSLQKERLIRTRRPYLEVNEKRLDAHFEDRG